jgi:DNA polymerase III delta prime subunit
MVCYLGPLSTSYGLINTLSVKLTEDGKEALLRLSRGDMRRALNVLQACHAAYPVTDEEAVYNCTGNPHPKDIEKVVQSMMGEEFGTCYQSAFPVLVCPCCCLSRSSPSVINSLKTDRGLALQDLITGAYDHIQDLELPAQSRVYLLDQLAVIEYVAINLSSAVSLIPNLFQASAVYRGIRENTTHGADCVLQKCRRANSRACMSATCFRSEQSPCNLTRYGDTRD